MKILVTGGAGFLGSHVADTLSDSGHDVVIFDLKKSPYLRSDQKMVIGDVRDEKAVNKVIADSDAIFHFAALADLNEALNKPVETMKINIMGTLNILEAAVKNKVKRLVFSSSIYVYSNQGSFYRTSKQSCEQIIQDYNDRYGLEYVILRYGSLYGPRADATNAVYKMIKSALERGRIEYGGNGKEVREYIHIKDAADMSVDALKKENKNQIMHLMGRERLTTGEMCEMIREIMGGKVKIVFGKKEMMGHYSLTPYSYTPRIGRKISRNAYIDLGLGLLDCIQHQAEVAPDIPAKRASVTKQKSTKITAKKIPGGENSMSAAGRNAT